MGKSMNTKDLLEKLMVFKKLLDEENNLIYEAGNESYFLDKENSHNNLTQTERLVNAEGLVSARKAQIRLEEMQQQLHLLNSELVFLVEQKAVDKIYVQLDDSNVYAEISRFSDEKNYGVKFFKAMVLP